MIKFKRLAMTIIYFVTFFENGYGQTPNVSLYQQNDSVTYCSDGLRSNFDGVVFKAVVDNYLQNNLSSVVFRVKKKSDEQPIQMPDLLFNGTCPHTDRIKCAFTTNHSVELNITVSAKTELSQAEISAMAFTNGRQVSLSNTLIFPEIFDSSNLTYNLTVNGDVTRFNKSDCVIPHHGSSSLDIGFQCKSLPSPCIIEIISHSSNITVQGKNVTEYQQINSKTQDGSFTIKYNQCALDANAKNFTCRFVTSYIQEYKNKDLLIGLSTGISAVLILIIGTVVKFVIMRRIQTRKKSKMEIEDDQEAGTSLTAPQTQPSVHTNISASKKKSSHTMSHFAKSDLPRGYKSQNLYVLIDYISKLTGRLSITHVSYQRPADYCEQYIIGSDEQRFATGIVIHVEKSTGANEVCHCSKCKGTEQPNMLKGKICFLTSKTVIFDASEADISTFKLFYSDRKSQDFKMLRGRSVKNDGKQHNWIEVECDTCDEILLNRLSNNLQKCIDQMKHVNKEFNKKGNQALTVIVSHPGDRPQEVSFGQLLQRKPANENANAIYTEYLYTNATSEGSRGAFVYVLGVSDISLKYVHVHSGINTKQLGFSSSGLDTINKNKTNGGQATSL